MRTVGSKVSGGFAALLAAYCLLTGGCGRQDTVPVSGTIMYKGHFVESGQIRFVPTGDTKGPVNVGRIVAGEYRIDARGGVPLGVYRVEIDAQKKTGRQIPGQIGMEAGIVDEWVRLGSERFGGRDSPLKAEVTAGKKRFDFEIPPE